jgi:hypothetical protein
MISPSRARARKLQAAELNVIEMHEQAAEFKEP